ncbi:hypothetical protein IWW55_001782 [Coemansia sp. RSA 2706]|nr:hypothetical protein IWW54_005308 [Coemansia sp. RSA 2705]KAJ2305741.1 hypothetical protein IWW55_001782 [Coemansia sp. RSA 2706]KAJ2327707.1 hypothetical protein IWW51_001601 [Coemansia sp. RSA 2702]KAJ2365126.1 hypothetical protein H4S01_003417 [Coemansia sp. RSA 2610]KAJ2379672.1 hypothetical protein H4S02_007065 [Coemansia sp. RSA 2611]KAJ2711827.1 hypothetical protein H4R23_006291 [Coemansia sp. Cherry 401B]
MSSSDSDASTPHPLFAADGDLPDNVQLLRSCESCRRKKRKCSGDRPTCSRCAAQNDTCQYRPTARFLKPRGQPALRKPKAKKRLADAQRPRAMSAVAAALTREHPVAALAPADLMLGPPGLTVTPGLSPGSDVSPQPSGLAYMAPHMLAGDLAQQLACPQLGVADDYSQLLASTIAQQQALMAVTSTMMDQQAAPLAPWPLMPDPGFPAYPLPPELRPTNLDAILPQPKNAFEWFAQ